ncbi:MAG: SymE family type I addiction module toxin [Lachnospiraceae bacterium]|nr:SymE family type I addiction module toxin [Lachnospiraceae bacterium]
MPKITIQGKWLDELGFCIGDKLTVTCREGELVIVKAGCRVTKQA